MIEEYVADLSHRKVVEPWGCPFYYCPRLNLDTLLSSREDPLGRDMVFINENMGRQVARLETK